MVNFIVDYCFRALGTLVSSRDGAIRLANSTPCHTLTIRLPAVFQKRQCKGGCMRNKLLKHTLTSIPNIQRMLEGVRKHPFGKQVPRVLLLSTASSPELEHLSRHLREKIHKKL